MSDSCPSAVPCPCDNLADTPYDGSAPEVRTFIATGFAAVTPPLGQSWTRLSCMMFSSSPVSQEAADFTAQQQAQLCALNAVSPYSPEDGPNGGSGGGGGGGGVVFFNSPQECTVTCPDGLPFTYQVPAGAFSGTTQAAADIAAQTFACAQANQRVICLSALNPNTYIVNSPYSGTIIATGGNLGSNPVWQLTSGSLPTGLTFSSSGNVATINGTPTVGGVFTFSVSCTDSLGDTMNKTFTLQCALTYVVTTNQLYDQYTNTSTTGFQLGTALAPYDTEWDSIVNACGQSHSCGPGCTLFTVQTFTFNVNFTSGSLKTWTLHIVLTAFGGTFDPAFYALTINGTVQGGWVVGVDTVTWDGTFTTDNCQNTAISLTATAWPPPSPRANCIKAVVEWITPS